MDVRKVRHTLARLNEVNEQMTSLSDNIWLDIDHRDNESVTAGADFIQQYNQAAQQLSKATASIEHLLLSYFHQERENIEPKIEHGSGDSKSNERMILELDRNQSYLLNDNFTFKRPYGFIFNGIAYRNLMTWKAVYLKVLEVLKSSHPTKFEQLTTDELFISNRGNPLFSHTPSKLRVAYKLPESFYAEINMSANTIKQNLIIILEFLVILKKACVFINEQGYNQPTDTSLQIGQFYDITYTERSNKLAPHTEDILVHSVAHRGQARPARAILFSHVKNNRVRIFKDPLDQLFDDCLQLTDTSPASCYMSQATGISSFSTILWQPDRDLHHQKNFTHDYYIYDNRIKIKFIGFQFPLASLSSQHIIRLSLARWWSADELEEKRCYLQLSGWY